MDKLEDAKNKYFESINNKELSIGEYQEKCLHGIIKFYCDNDVSHHEKKINGYIADVLNNDKIIEIQTKCFERLRKKLDSYLDDYEVEIVYPLFRNKRIIWLNSIEFKDYNRMSPKHMNIYNAFKEIYKIKKYIKHDNLKIKLIFLDGVEFKNLDGWDKTKKKHASSYNKLPISLVNEVCFNCISDYKILVNMVSDDFTSNDYANINHISVKDSRYVLNVLNELNIIEVVGKDKRNNIYRVR